ncbi:MAG TPA: hypothetical protein PKE25_02570 [Novosphingobium sp.]|nr:hypothetical protein [Novosphingobium sp.]
MAQRFRPGWTAIEWRVRQYGLLPAWALVPFQPSLITRMMRHGHADGQQF